MKNLTERLQYHINKLNEEEPTANRWGKKAAKVGAVLGGAGALAMSLNPKKTFSKAAAKYGKKLAGRVGQKHLSAHIGNTAIGAARGAVGGLTTGAGAGVIKDQLNKKKMGK